MIRVKIVKPNKNYKRGEVLNLTRNEAFGLIDQGVAEVTKDMQAGDYQMKYEDLPSIPKRKK